MRNKYFKYLCLCYLLFQGSFVFAQGDDLSKKLDQFKSQNDLSNWIYEQLDYANSNSEKATSLLQNAEKSSWRKTNNDDEHFAWINLLNTLGYYQLLDGKIIASINTYENALRFYRHHQINSYDIVEYTFKPLSNNYTRLGDYERALYLQKESIDFQKKYSEDANKIAAIYCNMAISYRSMDKLEEAYNAIADGLALKPSYFQQTMLNNVLADILYQEGNYNKAAAIIKKNINKQKATDAETAYWLMSAHTTAGNIYQKLQEHQKAQISYFEALKLLNRYYANGRVRERGNLYTQIAETYLAKNKPNEAISYGQKTLNTLGIKYAKNIYGDNKLVDVFMLLAKAHLQLKQPEKALKNINLSLLSADKIRNEFAADRTKERLQNYLKQIVEQGIAVSYQLYEQTKDTKYLQQILILAEQSKSRTLLDQIQRNQQAISQNIKGDTLFLKKQKLEQNISYLEKQAIEEQKSNIKDIEAIQFDLALINKTITKKYPQLNINIGYNLQLNKLPSHRFIEYFIGENDIYIINIYQNKIEQVVKLPDAEKIKSEVITYVKTYFHNGPNAMMNDPRGFFTSSNHIYQHILAPVKLNPNEKLTIIPDGILGYLSFDGLISNSNYVENISKWPFLIKSHCIDYAFSIKALQNNQTNSTSYGFAGLFVTNYGNNKTTLKAVKNEAALLDKAITGKFLFDNKVTPENFERLFSEKKVMHIGAHAYLSGQHNEPTLDLGKEKIYLFELSAKQSAPSLVVLSACQTADGILADGEGIISLSRGFISIGTTATVASLWNVNDDAASAIMGDFYIVLSSDQNASEALRQAKLNWINSTKSNNAMLLPYYWDSLIYMGKDQKIQLAKNYNWSLYGLVVGLSMLGFAVYILKRKQRSLHKI
ncbi:MAG: CHAT domain-containing protein [Pedobacter sp.]|uniref:CHAT domain-containing protein n=1 Tax=Pedobacter sp. TaxID=1411316 RepID=UPI002808F762|nr:CHAT domain-containing protein [Pedobacter sp.]MDQ8005565.1 CHAT domain-containing protein [Pedobacter sp.]